MVCLFGPYVHMILTSTALTFHVFRPIGGGTCGNLRDSSLTVSSVGMCASYAWRSNSKGGFCMLSGTQCFTSDTFQQDYASTTQAPCNTSGVMKCYGFEAQQQDLLLQRRSGAQSSDLSDSDVYNHQRHDQLASVSYTIPDD
jgi:hypothetical protein